MIVALAAALLFPAPINFGAYPLYDEAQKGSKLAADDHTMEVLYGNDRTTIGWWNDGTMARPMEWALWISPSFISRWLGYLDRRELWMGNSQKNRYQEVASILDGKLTFLVQLAAYPKQSLFDVTDEAPSKPQEIEKVRFVMTFGDKRYTPEVNRIALYQWRDRDYAKDFRWWLYVPFGDPLTPEWMTKGNAPPYAVGDWYTAWYLVQIPTLPQIFECEKFELRIISPRKERVATFPPKKPDLIPNFKIGH